MGLNLSSSTVTDLTNTYSDYSVDSLATEGVSEGDETYFDFDKATKHHGYYKTIPELKKSIDALASWTTGKGYTTDPETTVILDHIQDNGSQSFIEVLNNLIICKKVYGAAFAEIIRDEKKNLLLNLKVLDPASMRIVTNKKGMIIRYEQTTKAGGKPKVFKPKDILHLVNEKHADEVKGTSIIDACEWIILARNEALTDWKKVLHRNVVPLRIIEVDSDDTSKLNTLKTQYQEAISKGEVLVIPKGNVSIIESAPNLQDPLAWIQYLEQIFYFAVGVPKSVLGGSDTFTESSAKVSFISFEQVYTKEMNELEAALWNQLYLRIRFNRPPSLIESEALNEAKNTGQVGIQPNEVAAPKATGGRA